MSFRGSIAFVFLRNARTLYFQRKIQYFVISVSNHFVCSPNIFLEGISHSKYCRNN